MLFLTLHCGQIISQFFERQRHQFITYSWTKNNEFNLNGAIESIRSAPEKIPCNHAVMRKHDLMLFDLAYMGYARGNMDKEAEVIR